MSNNDDLFLRVVLQTNVSQDLSPSTTFFNNWATTNRIHSYVPFCERSVFVFYKRIHTRSYFISSSSTNLSLCFDSSSCSYSSLMTRGETAWTNFEMDIECWQEAHRIPVLRACDTVKNKRQRVVDLFRCCNHWRVTPMHVIAVTWCRLVWSLVATF